MQKEDQKLSLGEVEIADIAPEKCHWAGKRQMGEPPSEGCWVPCEYRHSDAEVEGRVGGQKSPSSQRPTKPVPPVMKIRQPLSLPNSPGTVRRWP